MKTYNKGIEGLHMEIDSKALAKEARAWVASQEGQKKIEDALMEARQVTLELNKYQKIEAGNFRVPFGW